MISMILLSRDTTVSMSLSSTTCSPMMVITESNSRRICLNHNSYTKGGGREGRGGVRAGLGGVAGVERVVGTGGVGVSVEPV